MYLQLAYLYLHLHLHLYLNLYLYLILCLRPGGDGFATCLFTSNWEGGQRMAGEMYCQTKFHKVSQKEDRNNALADLKN